LAGYELLNPVDFFFHTGNRDFRIGRSKKEQLWHETWMAVDMGTLGIKTTNRDFLKRVPKKTNGISL